MVTPRTAACDELALGRKAFAVVIVPLTLVWRRKLVYRSFASPRPGHQAKAHLKALPPIIDARLRNCCGSRQKACIKDEDIPSPHSSSNVFQYFLVGDADGVDRAIRAVPR